MEQKLRVYNSLSGKKEEFKPKLEYMELEGNILADVDLTTQPIILTKEQSSLRYEPGIQSQDFLDHPEKKKIKRGELSEYLDPLAKKITDYILQKTGTELKNATKEKIKETLNKMIQTHELHYVLQDNPIVMIYGPELKTHYLESMRESLYELNGIYKMNQMITDKTISNILFI